MENWLVVDQRTDPTPGSPEQVRALADRLRQQADQSRKAGQRLRGVAVDRARLRLWGDYADVLDVMLAELPDDAATLTTAYDACAAALSGYAQELDQVQTASRLALRQGTQAHERYQALLQRFCQVVPVSFQGGGLWRGLDAASAAHLSQGLREPERQWAVALGREAGMCEFERQTACRAVAEAAHRHQDAANRCAQAVLAAAPRLSANRSRRTTPTRQTQPKGAKIVSAHLEDADVFRTAKAAGTTPRGPAVLVLRNRPDFDKRDFDRKAKDLVRLGQEGRLSKAKSDRTSNNVYHRGGRGTKPGNRSRTNVFRDRVTRRLTRNKRLTQQHGTPETNQYLANKDLVDRLYGGRGPIGARGEGLDPDHVHELQLDGKDEYANLRLMDAWTNREIGREISVALRDVPEGTPVIVKVLP